jgi:hypothetical protein
MACGKGGGGEGGKRGATEGPAMNEIPSVGPFVGEAPEDRHALRVVGEMLFFLDAFTIKTRPQLLAAMKQPIGGTPKAQQRYLDRIKAIPSPAVIDIGANLGKRCRFSLILNVWTPDEFGGVEVWAYLAIGEGPGRVTRGGGPIWRLSRHALVRLVQRSEAHDAFQLPRVMRAMAGPITDGIADQGLLKSTGVIKVAFPGGIAVVEKPTDSEFPIVVTVLPPTDIVYASPV